MRKLSEQERRDSLNDVLIELSESPDILRESGKRVSFFERLESIYHKHGEDNFRHYYSDIFSILSLIDADSSIGSLDNLATNVKIIKEEYTPNKNQDDEGTCIDISKEIAKLYDHTNLDIARINYTKTMANETRSELVKTRLLVKELEQKNQQSETSLKELSSKTTGRLKDLSGEIQQRQEAMQKEYITILGIFAAIVLAFTGGIVFSGSVLENIDKVSIYRISLISFVIGLVFFNLIWALIDFIRDINGKTIRKKWLWALVNVILIGGIIGVCFSYQYGWFLPV